MHTVNIDLPQILPFKSPDYDYAFDDQFTNKRKSLQGSVDSKSHEAFKENK